MPLSPTTRGCRTAAPAPSPTAPPVPRGAAPAAARLLLFVVAAALVSLAGCARSGGDAGAGIAPVTVPAADAAKTAAESKAALNRSQPHDAARRAAGANAPTP